METYEIQDLTEAGKEILIIESMRAAGEDVASYYEIMGNAGWIEFKYTSYMTTEPVNVNEELKRLSATLDDVEEQNRNLQVKLKQEKETKLAITSALKSVTLTL